MAHAETLSPEEFFSAAVSGHPDIIGVSLREDGRYIQVNDEFIEKSGFSRDEVIGKTSVELGFWVDTEEYERFLALLDKDGRIRNFESSFRLKDGMVRDLQISAAAVRIGGRDCITTVGRDVTDRNEMVKNYTKRGHLLEHAEEMAEIGSWEFDYPTRKVAASCGACRIYGVEEGDFSVSTIENIPLPEYRPALDRARDDLIANGTPYDIEFRIARRSDGAVRDIHSKARWDPVNKRLFGVIRDVTEENRISAGLKKALTEKETLIKELYHRTKNNMQVIISLLGIEAARSDDPRIHEAFNDVERRIDSMSLVHEMLYQSSDLSHIDLRQFVPSLARLLISGLGDHTGRIAIDCDVGNVELLIDTAVPCGLILNELITNSLIHAFPAGRRGRISLKARREVDGTVVIEVRDDGVGISEPIGTIGTIGTIGLLEAMKSGPSMGLSLVSSIGRHQLGGTVDFETGGNGFGCVLRFKDTLYVARV